MALAAIRAMVRDVLEAIIGVGTLTHPKEFAEALDAGARFGVSPGLTAINLRGFQRPVGL